VSLLEAALSSAASVLLVPSGIAWPTGPIVAVATRLNDPSIEVARAISAVTAAEVVLVQAYKQRPLPRTTSTPPSGVKVITLSKEVLADARYVGATLGRLHERLVVMTREGFDKHKPVLVGPLRRVPVLVLGQPQNGIHDIPPAGTAAQRRGLREKIP
jgi:hypothetical protein